MLFELFSRARKEGLMALESDSDAPDKSPVFSKYPKFLKDHHALDFVCDTIRMAASGGVEPFDVDQMMELDMEVHHHGALLPTAALSTMADSLPGLRIVAAVLGVVITMGALGGPPEEIGHKVAAALVGTFLGILLCYGLVGPIASSMTKAVDDEHAYYHVMRVIIVSFMKGAPPSVAVEYGRRAKEAVGGYFKDPTGTAKQVGSDMVGAGENFIVNKNNMEELKEQLQKAIKEVPNFDKMKNHIDMTVTNEGLRIELSESANGTFFDSGSPKISADGAELLTTLAQELGKLPNTLAMEGHTDSKPYAAGSNYGNWELSSDRANAARRLM